MSRNDALPLAPTARRIGPLRRGPPDASSPGWTYFPTIPEILLTVGLVAFEILVFVLLVKRFPILGGTSAPATSRTAAITSLIFTFKALQIAL